MELRRLELFIAFVEEGTVTAAAGRVRLAQPALSRQLTALEKELHVRLFERSQNRLRLTPAGRHFVVVARELVAHAQRARAAAKALADGAVPELVLAAPAATLSALVAPYLATLQATDPLILAREVPIGAVYAALGDGADLAISPALPTGSLSRLALGFVPVRAYVASGHPWAVAGREWASLEELAQNRLFVLPRENYSRMEFELALSRANLTVADVVECEIARAIQAHAAAGRGIGMVTDYPRFGTYGVKVSTDGTPEGRILGITLYAAWQPRHYAASSIASIAAGLAAYFASTGLTLPDPK